MPNKNKGGNIKMDKTFATAINCMDGRVQEPVIDFIRNKYGVDYVDMITEAGPNRILRANKDRKAIKSIKKRVKISVDKHGSKLIAVVGHYDCAGNPVDKEQQIKDIKGAVKRVKDWGFDADVIGIWVDENWEAHQIIN